MSDAGLFSPGGYPSPDAAADFEKWAVVACDQFTSQPEYWRKAAEIVGDAPSTLNLVYPEAYLAEGDARIAGHHRQAMEDYMRRGVLQTRVKDGLCARPPRDRAENASGWSAGWIWSSTTSRPARCAPVRATEGQFLAHPAARAHPAGAPIESPTR